MSEIRWHRKCGRATPRYADGECVLCARERKARKYKGDSPDVYRHETDKYEVVITIRTK